MASVTLAVVFVVVVVVVSGGGGGGDDDDGWISMPTCRHLLAAVRLCDSKGHWEH